MDRITDRSDKISSVYRGFYARNQTNYQMINGVLKSVCTCKFKILNSTDLMIIGGETTCEEMKIHDQRQYSSLGICFSSFSLHHSITGCILKPSSNRSPNISTLVQKVKIGHTKRFNSNDKSRLCRDFAGYFISK